MRANLNFLTTSREPFLKTKLFCAARSTARMNFLTNSWKHPCLDIFTRWMKMFIIPDDFASYGKSGVEFFSTSDLLYPYLKHRIRLIWAWLKFHRISDNSYVSLGIVDCSHYTRRIVLKSDYHKKAMDMFAYTPVEYNYMKTLAKNIIILLSRQNQFIQEISFNKKALVRRIAEAMITISAFAGSYIKNPFWYQQFEYSEIVNRL